ncbi:serine/threonine protein kinase [Serratia marcescens]|uniref:Serine/threonine protein kinase n=1 Tax=Serratia marcescens TaxID=615 RepID=A0A1Q4P5H9_SERMA|nr:ATP-binding protein [Serratia marcescens]OKB68366.1 serine/threonine protein kinase [Serratia marcescens]
METATTALRLGATLENLDALSSALQRFVAPFALDPAAIYQMDLAASEAFSNIVRHGVNHDGRQAVDVTMSLSAGALSLTLVDGGRPIPPEILQALAEKQRTFPESGTLESWPESGIGLILIYSMMDDVRYRSTAGRNELILIKNATVEQA